MIIGIIIKIMNIRAVPQRLGGGRGEERKGESVWRRGMEGGGLGEGRWAKPP